MGNNPHIFLIISNQHIQEISRNFDGNLNHYGYTVFVENQEQNESFTFQKMLLQPDRSHFSSSNYQRGRSTQIQKSLDTDEKQ